MCVDLHSGVAISTLKKKNKREVLCGQFGCRWHLLLNSRYDPSSHRFYFIFCVSCNSRVISWCWRTQVAVLESHTNHLCVSICCSMFIGQFHFWSSLDLQWCDSRRSVKSWELGLRVLCLHFSPNTELQAFIFSCLVFESSRFSITSGSRFCHDFFFSSFNLLEMLFLPLSWLTCIFVASHLQDCHHYTFYKISIM
jgi:hypothetical protein